MSPAKRDRIIRQGNLYLLMAQTHWRVHLNSDRVSFGLQKNSAEEEASISCFLRLRAMQHDGAVYLEYAKVLTLVECTFPLIL